MKQITISEARELLFSSDAKYVSQEQSAIYYDNFSGRIKVDTYFSFGCLIVKSDNDWHVHALDESDDIISAINEVKELIDTSYGKLMVLTRERIPEELMDNRGAYKFVRGYLPYDDSSVRPLSRDDAKKVRQCCAYDADDNQIGKNIASDFISYYDDYMNDTKVTNLGLFEDDCLVGFVQAFAQRELRLSTVNIYVSRAHRNKGYAKRLLSAICATSENTAYCYSCVKTNTASINTAKSCGFQFKGAYLFI